MPCALVNIGEALRPHRRLGVGRPSATPSGCAGGMQRRRHTGQVLAMKTCSVTCTGTTGNSMTSTERCAPTVQPLFR